MGGRSGTLTPRARAARVERIIEQRARGLRWFTIAGELGISERQAQRLYAEGCGSSGEAWAGRDPVELAGEIVNQYDAAIEDLALLASSTKHDGTKLGAIKSRVDVIESRAHLLMALGVLPEQRGDLALMLDGREAARRVTAVLEEFEMPDEVVVAMARALGVEVE